MTHYPNGVAENNVTVASLCNEPLLDMGGGRRIKAIHGAAASHDIDQVTCTKCLRILAKGVRG